MTRTIHMPRLPGTRARRQINRLIARDGLNCHWCGRLCDPALGPAADLAPTRDHVLRRADGGTSAMHNLVLSCRKCNNTRHAAGWCAKGRGEVPT